MSDEFDNNERDKLRQLLKYHVILLFLGRFGYGVREIFLFLSWFSDNSGKVLRWLAIGLMTFAALEREYLIRVLEVIVK